MRNLKCFTLCLLTFFICNGIMGQPPVKLFAYEQSVLPGTIPSGVTDEQGNPINTSRAGHSTNFFLYLLQSPSAAIKPVSIWIKGKGYPFTTEAVSSTPVVKQIPGNGGSPTDHILVPRTPMKVTRLNVSHPLVNQPAASAALKKQIGASEVVVGVMWQGKLYYSRLKALKTLPPIMHQ